MIMSYCTLPIRAFYMNSLHSTVDEHPNLELCQEIEFLTTRYVAVTLVSLLEALLQTGAALKEPYVSDTNFSNTENETAFL